MEKLGGRRERHAKEMGIKAKPLPKIKLAKKPNGGGGTLQGAAEVELVHLNVAGVEPYGSRDDICDDHEQDRYAYEMEESYDVDHGATTELLNFLESNNILVETNGVTANQLLLMVSDPRRCKHHVPRGGVRNRGFPV